MAKKKTYFQAICYTTDHCDGDLIAPACWEPTAARTEAAIQIMQEIEESFADQIRTSKQLGPDYLTIEYRLDTTESTEWRFKIVKNWKRNKDFFAMLQKGLADGTITTVMVNVPEYLNYWGVMIEKRSDVFHINQFTL
jgi:hypothetical protein